MKTRNVDTLQSVQMAFKIIAYLKEHDGARVTELANEFNISKSTAHRYLATLVQLRYAVKDNDHTYKLGLRFIGLGSHLKNREPLYEMAQQKAEQLAEETGERAQFIVEEHGRGVYVHRETGENAVKTDAREGKEVFLSTTAAGKAILAHLPRSRVEEIVDQWDLPPRTEHTIVTEEELYERLTEIRERGYAYNREEHTEGLYAVGAPIQDESGTVLGSLSISGPTNRVKDRILNEGIPKQLLGAVNEVELQLKYS